MGGLGSGGHNKTHDQIEEQYFRVDSFAVHGHVHYDKYAGYKDCIDMSAGGTKIRYHVKEKEAEILENGEYYPLELSRVKNIDGNTERLYFLCPWCGKRVRYLYKHRGNGFYICRQCAGLNYKSQQVNGMDKLRIKMQNIVEKKLRYYGWQRQYDTIADLYFIPKPLYMPWEKYGKLLQEYKRLQKSYEEELRRVMIGGSGSLKLLWKYNQMKGLGS